MPSFSLFFISYLLVYLSYILIALELPPRGRCVTLGNRVSIALRSVVMYIHSMGSRTPTLTLWSYIQQRELSELDTENRIGPYREDGKVICRHMSCSDYDACLSYAAKNRWPSFNCMGCRRTQSGEFVEEKENQ